MKLEFGKRLFTPRETYKIVYDGMRTVRYLSRARRSESLDRQFMERLMLAVTEVNGCALCAWGHARAALESGMSGAEIQAMLAGEIDHVPAAEVPAVLFAQHYADTRGRPSPVAWLRLVELYGEAGALGILGAIRMIMIGNAYGIAGGAFLNRLRGNPDPQSSLAYEVGMMAGTALMPAAMLQAALSGLMRRPVLAFPAPQPAS